MIGLKLIMYVAKISEITALGGFQALRSLVNQLVVSKNEFECKFWLVISTVVTRLGPQLQNWVRSQVAPA